MCRGASFTDKVHICFASQSGTAEFFAGELAEELGELGIENEVEDLADFDKREFVQHKLVVLVVSTYGEGDPPDNVRDFYRWNRRKTTPAGTLSHMGYAVFGLGDMNYSTFNKMGEETDKHFERLGATRFFRRGVGDACQDIEADFAAWKFEIIPAIQKAMEEGPVAIRPQDGKVFGRRQSIPRRASMQCSTPRVSLLTPSNSLLTLATPFDAYATPSCFLGAGRRDSLVPVEFAWGADDKGAVVPSEAQAKALFGLTPSRATAQPCGPRASEVTLHSWTTFDTMGNVDVLCPQPAEDVAFFADAFGVDLQQTFRFEGKGRFPTPCTVEHALTYFLDLQRVPMQRIGQWAKEGLVVLKDASGVPLAGDHATDDAMLTLREFWALVAKMTFEDFAVNAPLAKARAMTLCSSAADGPATFVVAHTARDQLPALPAAFGAAGARSFRGLATRALSQPECTVLLRARPSHFALPRPATLWAIGAGSGAAPFRALYRQGTEGLTLAIGARTPDEVPFAEEAATRSVRMLTAFSRVAETTPAHVQDRLHEHADDVRAALAAGGAVWVCGSSGVGQSVLTALREIAGAPTVEQLIADKRLLLETWG